MRPTAPEMIYPDLDPPGGVAPAVRVTAERRMKRDPQASRAEGRQRQSKQSALGFLRARLNGRAARV
jgi:hypothetical protein